MAGEAFGLRADMKAELARLGQTLKPDAVMSALPPPTGEHVDVVLLERVVEGVEPEYCIHGYVSCVHCRHLCWLGSEAEKLVRGRGAYPLCLDCARKVVYRRITGWPRASPITDAPTVRMTTEMPIPTPNGFDSVIAARNPQWVSFLPEGLEVRLLGSRAAVVDGEPWAIDNAETLVKITAVMRLLVRQSVAMAGLPPVRSAWFTVTTDATIVKMYDEAHGCAKCRAGTDQAIARLRERPDDPLVVGILAF